MKKLRALIIDDERLARKDLSDLLKAHENVVVAGEAENVDEAEQLINNNDIDLLFLDIQMPGDSGFELVKRIDKNIKVIFVTAYDEYAIRAFEINALDYLLKPVHPERLSSALSRVEDKQLNDNPSVEKLEYTDQLFINLNNKMNFLKLNEILFISSAGDYSEIHKTDGTKGLTLKSMKEWEERLPEKAFCRIHRSTIANTRYIVKVEEWFNNSYRIYLESYSKPLAMSRRHAAKLKKTMG